MLLYWILPPRQHIAYELRKGDILSLKRRQKSRVKCTGISDFCRGFSGFNIIRDLVVHFVKSFRNSQRQTPSFLFRDPNFVM
jgi:hypothetical protein